MLSPQSTLAGDKLVPEWLAISVGPRKMDSITRKEEKVSRWGCRCETPEICRGIPRCICEESHPLGQCGRQPFGRACAFALNHPFLQKQNGTPSPSNLIQWPLRKGKKKNLNRKENIQKLQETPPHPLPTACLCSPHRPPHPPPLFNVSNFMPCSLPLSARLSKADRRIPLLFRVLKPLSRSDSLFYSATL